MRLVSVVALFQRETAVSRGKRVEFSTDLKNWEVKVTWTDEEAAEQWQKLQEWIQAVQPFGFFRLVNNAATEVLSISRFEKYDDLGLIGGKIEPGETPEQAIIREIQEEVGVSVRFEDIEHVYDRLDERKDDDGVCRCFRVLRYLGEPRAMESGFVVEWVPLKRLLEENCVFRSYNRALFVHLGLIGAPA